MNQIQYPKQSVLIHIPHCSLNIPDHYRDQMLLSEVEIQAEMLLMTDRYVDELFDFQGVMIHQNNVSRLVMDPERFRSDANEPMALQGMGAIYTKTSQGRTYRALSTGEKENLLVSLYDPYHLDFTDKVESILRRTDRCLIIDAHSFPAKPLSYEIHQAPDRPDICLGFDAYHMNQQMIDVAKEYFQSYRLSVALNFPFSGSIVPMRFYHQDRLVQSLMIEINRALYMDEKTGLKLQRFDEIRKIIHGFFELLS